MAMLYQHFIHYASLHAPRTYPCHAEHPARCLHAVGVGVLVAEVHHLLDAALDDGLGALIAWKQPHVDLIKEKASGTRSITSYMT